jgi:hypothetical protein
MIKKKFFKKGIVESQMAWIFILFAGALILIVFYRIASNQKEISELRIQAEISSKIRSAITSFSTGYEAKSEIETANALIKNSCEGISVKNSRPINLNVFSFKQLNPKTSKLLVYSVPWNFPFDIDNLILLIEPETKFVIVKNSKYDNLIQKIKENFPEKTNFIEVQTIEDALKEESTGKKRIVMFEQTPSFQTKTDKETSFVIIQSISGKDINNFGEVTFYNTELKNNVYSVVSEGTSYYLGFQMLLAAINSDKEIYDCNFKKNMKKFYYFLSILEERTNNIYKNLQSNSDCKSSVGAAKNIVSDTKNKLNDFLKNNVGLSDFYDYAEKLKIANNELILKSCPEIY